MTQNSEITDLTICRAFFAAWVFTYHVDLYVRFSTWLGPFHGLIRQGYLGVDGFFVLSGFILAHVHPELSFNPKSSSAGVVSLQNMLIFWGKRLARIYPVHIVTLCLIAVIVLAGLALGLTPRDPSRFTLASLVQNIFLVHGWGFTYQGAWNYPSWSVSTEWAGYLAFPLLMALLTYFDWYVAPQFMIIMFVLLGLIVTRYHGLNLSFGDGLTRFFPEFFLGMCTQRFVPHVADFDPLRNFCLLGGLSITVIFAAIGDDLFTVLGIWMVLFACAMQADAHCPPILNSRRLRWFGQLSYAFYMSFALAELLVSQWFRHQGWPLSSHGLIFAAGMTAITFVLAIVLHITVEKPCRRAADRWLEAFVK